MDYGKQYGCPPLETQFCLQCSDDFARENGYYRNVVP